MSEFKLVPTELTAENGAKAVLMGEFFEEQIIDCPDCDGFHDDGDPCETCSDGTVTQRIPVSWTTIKAIWKKALEVVAAPAVQQAEPATQEQRSEWWHNLRSIVDGYVDGYEFRGDSGDYTPNEKERVLIEDCIAGLIDELPFLKPWENQGAQQTPQPAQPTIQYSTDYDALWDLICAGHEALAFVDYRFMDEPKDYKPWRDAAKVTRRGPYQINIGARGISYASAHEFDAPKWPDEKELFIKICKNTNLEWASPQQSAPCPEAGQQSPDKSALTRELDVLLNGEEGAAPQASLCDLVAQLRLIVSRTGNPVLAQPAPRPVPDLPVAITPDEMASLARFCETCEDGQEYDVPVEMMRQLAVIGLVRRTTGSRYEITNFGLAVTAGKFNALPAQPEQPAPIKTGPSGKTMWTATMPDRRKKPASIPAVNQRCEIGIYGKSWDGPEATRAYTHEHQPNNVGASRLGRAVYKVRQHTPGDHIDLGLYLLRELMDVGFGVFELPRPAAPDSGDVL